MLACYTDKLSACPGEVIALHASSTSPDCTLEIARLGRERVVAFGPTKVSVGDHPTPADADRNGCGWPVASTIQVGEWPTGYYDIVLASAAGEATHHFVCVRKADAAPRARAALILSTNTYHAYNWWGGANAYCDVASVMAGEMNLIAGMRRAIGRLSTRRPFIQGLVAMARGAPRLINEGVRGFKERARGPAQDFWREHHYSTFDGSAGFINKWEHAFAVWAESNDLELDYLTDYDLDSNPDALDGYKVALAVGHSEYWSGRQRSAVEHFVDAGGNLAIFSGNTCYWKVRWEDDGETMVCHKWKGFDAEPDAGADGTHLWSHPAFSAPEASLTGLTFLFGGYHRLGMAVARGAGAYTVYNEAHWSLEGADLFYGDLLGAGVPLIGYESDGCRFTFDEAGLPRAVPRLGVPENLEIIAVAPCAYGEDLDRGYKPMLPPEDFGAAARVVYGDDSPQSIRKLLRGHAVMASFKRGAGEVFNVGTTEWAHALRAGEPFIGKITMNVLRRFGAFAAE
jgi:hypothetical protein